jgi:hypothetical protein
LTSVFFSESYVLLNVIPNRWIISNILPRCLARTLDYPLLFSIFYKSQIPIITIFIFLLWAYRPRTIVLCRWQCWKYSLSRSIMRNYICFLIIRFQSVLSTNTVFVWSLFKLVFLYFFVLYGFCDFLIQVLFFGVVVHHATVRGCLSSIVAVNCYVVWLLSTTLWFESQIAIVIMWLVLFQWQIAHFSLSIAILALPINQWINLHFKVCRL